MGPSRAKHKRAVKVQAVELDIAIAKLVIQALDHSGCDGGILQNRRNRHEQQAITLAGRPPRRGHSIKGQDQT